jgi:hypothetical protein
MMLPPSLLPPMAMNSWESKNSLADHYSKPTVVCV